MNNLTTLIKRLEAATSRLEDIASSSAALDQQQPQTNGASSGAATGSTPAGASQPTGPPTAPAPAFSQPSASTVPPMIQAFDALIDGDLKKFASLSNALNGLITEQASRVSAAFVAERQFLLITTKAKKPDMASQAYMETIKDIQSELSKVDEIRQRNRGSPLKNHLAMVADGVGALGWVTAESKPADLLSELFGGAQMWGNKVLKEYKETEPIHVEWVQSFYTLFRSLIDYVKEHHPRGVQWNSNGTDALEALSQIKTTPDGVGAQTNPPAAAAAPPPPPPLPKFDDLPPPPPPSSTSSRSTPAPDMNAVFDQLNRGEAVTAGLKRVDASQMTHKNPSLRAQAPVPQRSDSSSSTGRGKSPTPPGKKPKPESMRTKKPPRKELDGNKWIIENFEDHPDAIEIQASLTHSILITRCKNTTIRILGKANAISADSSPRLSILLDSLVSAVDVIKCPNFALQVLGTLPTVLLDRVDGAQLYLGQRSLGTEVLTSKCSGVNVVLPPREEGGAVAGKAGGGQGGEEEDYKECPVPEQIRSFVREGALVSEIVEHAG